MHGNRFWQHFHGHDFDGRRGPFDGRERGGRGGRGGAGWVMFGGPNGPGNAGFDFRTGRKLTSAQLQLVLLALIGDKPRHGYDLIKAVDEKSGGFYVPSPGVIYPALTYLEEAGDFAAEAEGSRKLYSLTDAGKERLAKQRAEVDAILKQLEAIAARMNRVRDAFTDEGEEGEASPPDFGGGPWGAGPWAAHGGLRSTIAQLFASVKQSKRLSPDAQQEIAMVVQKALQAIRAIIEADRE